MSTNAISNEERLAALSDEKAQLLQMLIKERAGRTQPITPYPRRVQDGRARSRTSSAQQRLWFVNQLEGSSQAYHIAITVRLRGQLDPDALRKALDALVQRHEILRTVFVTQEGEPWQEITAEGRFALSFVDLAHQDADARDDRVRQHKIEEAYQPFDLERGPLIRGRLLSVAPDEHILLITMHHIVSDGWSMGVFIRELTALYEAHLHGRADPLQPLPVQYADYAQWQRQWLAHGRHEQQLSYWRARLEGAPSHLELPTDRPRPKLQSYRGKKLQFTLDAQLCTALKDFARREGVTFFMLLCAGWTLLLSRLSGQAEVVIGTPVANRRRPELEGLIGFFVNTLVLRLKCDPDATVRTLLAHVREVTLGAYDHQDVPFEQIVEALQPERTFGVNPLFQVMLVLQNAPTSELRLPGLAVTWEDDLYEASKFDLLLSLEERNERLAGRVSYSTDLFDPQTIERWMSSFTVLLHAMTESADTSIDELPILPEHAWFQVVRMFNATQAPCPRDSFVHQLFEQQVERTPDATAVAYEGQSLTYRQLNHRANQLARFLRGRGVGPDQLVGVCLERSVEMIVGVLSILKAGGAYLPIDPNYPAERVAYMLEDAQPQLMLTQERLRRLLPYAGRRMVALDSDRHEVEVCAGAQNIAPLPQQTSENPVYVIYTSGSTGRPKGTAMPHRSMINLIEWHRRHLPCDGLRVLQFAALSFDVAFQEIFSTLCMGGTLTLLDEWVRRDTAALIRLLNAERINRVFLPPLMLQSLAECAAANEDLMPEQLQDVITAGEQLRITAEICALFGRMPNCRLHNHYGPTETHVVTALTLDPDPAQWPPLPTIGRPIANTQIYILDGHGRPVPIGVVGEIYIAGTGLARGYLHRAELTSQRFVRDPFGTEPDSRMYKTGDLGRWRTDGAIEYLGRNDDQVKIRGFRVELGEIAAHLEQHREVRECAVIAWRDGARGDRLVAYVVLRDGRATDVEELRAHVKTGLPDHMIPSAFVVMERLPVTPSGKLDRRALPQPQFAEYSGRRYEPPRDESERILAGIWEQLLKLEKVGRHDNFFRLGGHSLLVVQMLDRLRRAGFSADVRSIYMSQTLADAARTLHREGAQRFHVPPNLIPPDCEAITPQMLPLVELTQQQIDRIVGRVPGGAANVQDIYPLAPLQEGVLFHHVLNERGGDTYVRPLLFGLETKEMLQNLIRALQKAIDRHDTLRTAVLWEHLPAAVQVVYRHAELPVREIVLDPGRDVVEQLKERMRPEHRRLDLRKAPLVELQFAAHRDSSACYALLQTHHILFDQQSLQTLLADLMALLHGDATDLPPAVPYRNHVAWARAESKAREAEAFFRRKLGDVDQPTAPFGLLDVHGDGSQVEGARLLLEPHLSRRIRAQSQQLGIGAATLFHAAWALVVGATSGCDDIVFGTVLLGRLHEDATQPTLGMFMNTLPLRLRLRDVTAAQLVEHTRAELAELLQHEQTPLASAQRCSRVSGSAPLFTALLNCLHTGGKLESGSLAAPGVTLVAGEGTTNYPVTLAADDQGDAFLLNVQTDRRIDPRRIVGYMMTAVQSLLTALEQAPQTPALSLRILDEPEYRCVLEQFNATHRPYPQEVLVHQLIEQQAARTPDAIAVIYGQQGLTYDQLNRRANQLAHYLRACGVGPDRLVGICIERSLEMVVGLLAILKAGGAYVPLDPGYPRERLAYMLADSAPAVLLTQSFLRQQLPETAAKTVALDEWGEIAERPDGNIEAGVLRLTASNLAYVIYTSGSTGRPKGAMNEHRAVVNRLQWMQDAYGLGAHDAVLQKTPFSFDVSVWEFFWTLMAGARLVVARPQGHKDPEYLRELISETSVTTLHFVPSMLQAFLEQHRPEDCPSLRHIVCSGEELSSALQNRCLRAIPQARLSNLYGPTEAAVDVTAWECEILESGSRVPIGRPISNIQIYVLDRSLRPTPVGVAGEIYIGGTGVGRGYLNRAELTTERFIDDPFSANPNAKLYKTGDLGVWRPDGVLEYLGRNDHQVKLRGFRIELGEIEAVLAQHEDVKEAAVVAREDRAGEKRLVAYFTAADPSAGKLLSVETLRAYSKQALPDYMVPSAFVLLESLPLTPNGKLDRKALPAPDLDAFGEWQYEPPRGELEEAIARIWAELLGVDRIGRHDDFFELGGHSLHGMGLIAMINARFAVHLPVIAVFQYPTVRHMAEAITALGAALDTANLTHEAEQTEEGVL